MGSVILNKFGRITIENELILKSVRMCVKNFSNQKLLDLSFRQLINNRFYFYLTFEKQLNEKFINNLDVLSIHLSEWMQTNLQIFGSIIVMKLI